jgi:hypothetical protein
VVLWDNWRLRDCVGGRIVVVVIHHNDSVNDRALLASVLLVICRKEWMGLDAGHDSLVVLVFFVCLLSIL